MKERDEFYTSVSYSGWGGSSGHDACIIAYDALLGAVLPFSAAEERFEELVKRAALHGGDSDSTGNRSGVSRLLSRQPSSRSHATAPCLKKPAYQTISSRI